MKFMTDFDSYYINNVFNMTFDKQLILDFEITIENHCKFVIVQQKR